MITLLATAYGTVHFSSHFDFVPILLAHARLHMETISIMDN